MLWVDMYASKEDLICPCCGKHYFGEQDAYEICPVCGWEDDKVQRNNPDFEGGANKLSLNQAREEWAKTLEAMEDKDYCEDLGEQEGEAE